MSGSAATKILRDIEFIWLALLADVSEPLQSLVEFTGYAASMMQSLYG